MVFSSILLGEPFGLIEVGAAITSFIGVVLVSNPRLQLDFSAGQSPGFAIGCCAVLVSSITVALTYCFLRAVNTHVHYMVSVLALGVGGGILGALLGGASPSAMLADTHSLRLVLVGSVGGLFGSCCLSKAFSYCRAGTGTIMRNIDVPIAYILGVVVLGEIPRVGSLIGAALVIAGTVVVGSRSVFRKSAANVETTETLRSG